jgi:hypothetical protein
MDEEPSPLTARVLILLAIGALILTAFVLVNRL